MAFIGTYGQAVGLGDFAPYLLYVHFSVVPAYAVAVRS
jgi:hypothetical protein